VRALEEDGLHPYRGAAEENEDNEDIPSISFKDAFFVKGVLQFGFSFFFIKFAYYGVYYWVPTYLQDELGYTRD